MSKNDVVAIFKFRTTDGRVKYYVWYEHGNSDVIDSMTFAEFREFVKGKRLTRNLETAKTIAAQLQRTNIPEYSFVVYDGYYNAFFTEHGYPNPSTGLQLKTNPVYLGLGEGDYVYDVRDKLDYEEPVDLEAIEAVWAMEIAEAAEAIEAVELADYEVRAAQWTSDKSSNSKELLQVKEELVKTKQELERSKLEVAYLKREAEALRQRAIILELGIRL